MKHVHEYHKGKGNVDICACGRFKFNEKAGPAIVEIKPCNCNYWPQYGIEYCPLHKAAPDMLEALKLALATIERIKPPRPYDSTHDTRDVINAAIAKAEGRE